VTETVVIFTGWSPKGGPERCYMLGCIPVSVGL